MKTQSRLHRCGLLATIAGVSLALASGVALADAVAIAGGAADVKPTNSVFVAGAPSPGAVCARAEAGANTDPAAGAGNPCDDMAAIPGAGGVTILSDRQAQQLGDKHRDLSGPGGGALGPAGGQARARMLEYNRMTSAAKVPAAGAAPATMTVGATATSPLPAPQTTAKADATQTTIAGLAGGGASVGLAQAEVLRPPGAPRGLAIAIVNDPFSVEPLDIGVPFEVDIFATDLQLRASESGDSAYANYFLAVDGNPLLGLGIGIDFGTAALNDVLFDLFAFDATFFGALGYADAADYLDTAILPFLAFDASAHRLTATGDVLLATIRDTVQREIRYDYFAMAGTVAEPDTLALVGLALAIVGMSSKRHLAPRLAIGRRC